MKAVRVNPKISHHKENFLFYFLKLYLYDIMDVSRSEGRDGWGNIVA